jgi:hypothetical protein
MSVDNQQRNDFTMIQSVPAWSSHIPVGISSPELPAVTNQPGSATSTEEIEERLIYVFDDSGANPQLTGEGENNSEHFSTCDARKLHVYYPILQMLAAQANCH